MVNSLTQYSRSRKKNKQKINSRKEDWNEVHHRIRKNCECEIERTGERVARETN